MVAPAEVGLGKRVEGSRSDKPDGSFVIPNES